MTRLIIPQSKPLDLDDLKSRSDIVEVAGDLGLKVKKRGKSYFTYCPAHEDVDPPDLSLKPGEGARCFACGWTGSVIDLVAKVQKVDAGEAIRWLAKRAGMETGAGEARAVLPVGAPLPKRAASAAAADHRPQAVKAAPAQGDQQQAAAADQADDYDGPPPDDSFAAGPADFDDFDAGPALPPDHAGAPAAPASAAPAAPVADQAQGDQPRPAWAGLSPAPRLVEVVEEVVDLGFPVDTKITPPRPWRAYKPGMVKAAFTRAELVAALVATGRPADQVAREVDALFAQKAARGQVGVRRLTKTTPARPPSLRVRVFAALLAQLQAAPSPGSAWLVEKKSITVETQARFGIGWLADWAKADRELRAEFGDEALTSLGLLAEAKNGKPVRLRFEDHRLIIPFFIPSDHGLAPVFLQARNPQATGNDRFRRPGGPTPCPFNVVAISEARAAGRRLFITEGETDCLTLAQAGEYAVGILGGQNFAPKWARLFAGLDQVFVCRDPDATGETFARKVTQAFVAAGLHAPKVVALPAGRDVNDILTGKASKVKHEDA